MSLLTQELSDLAGQWIVQPRYISVAQATKATQICSANPFRWALVISFPLTTGGFIFPDPALVANQGFPTQNAALNLLMSYRDFGGLVQVPWFAANPGGPGAYTVSLIEVLLQQ